MGGQTVSGYTSEIEIFDPLIENNTIPDQQVFIRNEANTINGYLMPIYMEPEARIYLWGMAMTTTTTTTKTESNTFLISNAIRSNTLSSPTITNTNIPTPSPSFLIIDIETKGEQPSSSSSSEVDGDIDIDPGIIVTSPNKNDNELVDKDTDPAILTFIADNLAIIVLISIVIMFLICICFITFCAVKQHKYLKAQTDEIYQLEKLDVPWKNANRVRIATQSQISFVKDEIAKPTTPSKSNTNTNKYKCTS